MSDHHDPYSEFYAFSRSHPEDCYLDEIEQDRLDDYAESAPRERPGYHRQEVASERDA